jgi:Rrf2 family protein
MQLNVSTCYAMQVLLHLIRNERVVSSAELSKSLNISQRYIIQIASRLRDAGFISVRAGKRGGYILNRDASSFSAYDIITLMEGDMNLPSYLTCMPNCMEVGNISGLRNTLSTMKDYVGAYLRTITFDKLTDIEIGGKLSDVLKLVETQIDEMRKKK